jgi:hypothetical protein
MNSEQPDFPQRGAFRWRELGYHFQLPPELNLERLGGVGSSDPWITFLSVFEEAKGGNFSNLSRLVNCILTTDDWVMLRAATEVLGDTGSSCLRSSLEEIYRQGLQKDDPVLIEFCRSLWCSHFLWVVPIITEIYLDTQFRNDSAILPINLAQLLGNKYIPFPEIIGSGDDEYKKNIQDRYELLRTQFNGDNVPIWKGKIYSVKKIASEFLDDLRKNELLLEANFFCYRHKFEAATGIDCSGMFVNGTPQPLVASAIIEEFLEGPRVTLFENGVRYFFGHRIPD